MCVAVEVSETPVSEFWESSQYHALKIPLPLNYNMNVCSTVPC